MKFHVNRDVFSEAVSFVVKLLPQRNPQPILAGVLIEASDARTVPRGVRLRGIRAHRRSRRLSTSRARSSCPAGCSSEIASRLPNAPDPGRGRRRRRHRRSAAVPRDSPSRRMPVQEYPAIPEVSGDSGLVPGRGLRDRDRPGRVRGIPRRCDAGPHRRAARGARHKPQPRRDRPLPRRRCARSPGTAAARPATSRPPRSFRRAPCTEVGKTFAHGGDISIAFSGSRRPRDHRVHRRQQDRHLAAHQGQLPAGAAAVPRADRAPRGHQHRRAHRGRPPRVARARPVGRRCASPSRPTACRWMPRHRAGPGVRVGRREPHRRGRHARR